MIDIEKAVSLMIFIFLSGAGLSVGEDFFEGGELPKDYNIKCRPTPSFSGGKEYQLKSWQEADCGGSN